MLACNGVPVCGWVVVFVCLWPSVCSWGQSLFSLANKLTGTPHHHHKENVLCCACLVSFRLSKHHNRHQQQQQQLQQRKRNSCPVARQNARNRQMRPYENRSMASASSGAHTENDKMSREPIVESHQCNKSNSSI